MIDLIERAIFDNALHVKKLDNKDALFMQRLTDAFCNRMQLLQVKKDTCSVNDTKLAVDLPRYIQIKECIQGRDTGVLGESCRSLRRFHAEHVPA